jgi:hypothetical protein
VQAAAAGGQKAKDVLLWLRDWEAGKAKIEDEEKTEWIGGRKITIAAMNLNHDDGSSGGEEE